MRVGVEPTRATEIAGPVGLLPFAEPPLAAVMGLQILVGELAK